MKNGEKPLANPYVLLREEFDDWAVLFDPDTGRGFGLSPTGVYVYKLLDGERSISDMLAALRRDAENVPEVAGEHLVAFVEALARHGLAAYEAEQVQEYRGHRPSRRASVPDNVSDAMHFTYACPQLVNLSGDAQGSCITCLEGSAAKSNCNPGHNAYYGCCNGSGVTVTISCDYNDCHAGGNAYCDCLTYGSSAAGSIGCDNGVSVL